ncbi:hypothetical protein [Chitinasiproducens palmae]|uniref:Uncharacterized protein n=1 Tax=Chitinasiproducens palmae TaxID=1770053 RepID=A0A1H2PY14_9BURK|nr:hypothetical protein [Chitinasiproducens palmae]SDV51587.1 hypothetical protein SAMN05216551_1198 [Chitinasiproducens palmae]
MAFSRKHHAQHCIVDAAAPARRSRTSGWPDYLTLLSTWQPFARLETKLARARKQDEPVLYQHILPGLDVLLCGVRGALPPYPRLAELRARCLEAIADALEQPLDRLAQGGYWYERDGFACLVFASCSREAVLADYGMATR